MKRLLIILLCGTALTACTSSLKKENEALREEIDERREALREKQLSELADAREQLALTDSLLTEAQREHDALHEWVMSHSTQLNERSPEVQRLNELRARRDSLHVAFETLAHKVKFFLRQTEGNADAEDDADADVDNDADDNADSAAETEKSERE